MADPVRANNRQDSPGSEPAATPVGAAEPPRPTPTAAETAAPRKGLLESRLDDLRGLLAGVERVVSVRTQVGLVLLALAIGFGAAALYVAIDARENGASESRVESLRDALQALNLRSARTADQLADLRRAVRSLGSEATGAGSTVQDLQAQISKLQAQVGRLQGGPAGTGAGAENAKPGTTPAGTDEAGTK